MFRSTGFTPCTKGTYRQGYPDVRDFRRTSICFFCSKIFAAAAAAAGAPVDHCAETAEALAAAAAAQIFEKITSAHLDFVN